MSRRHPPEEQERDNAGPLFSVPLRHLARRTDPETSKLAASAIQPHLGRLQREAVELIREHPGHTSSELARLANQPDPRRINRRLSELVKAGIVEPGEARACDVTGRMAQTWRVVPSSHPPQQSPP